MTAEGVLSIAEKWMPVPDYEGLYEVSNFGNVRSLDRTVKGRPGTYAKIKGKTLTPIKNSEGYLRVNLCSERGRKAEFVHRLVAKAFIKNFDNLPEVNHKDENKENNFVENLEWCDSKYNSNYGTIRKRRSEHSKGKPKHYTYESFRRMVAPKEKAVIGIHYETNHKVSFRSIASAKEAGFSPVGISHCITNRQKTHKGYTWRMA